MPTVVSMTILMVLVCLFAKSSDKRSRKIQTAYGEVYKEKFFVFLIVVSLSLYGAMRTTGNDTYQYINQFNNRLSDLSISDFISSGLWNDEKGPLFALFQIFFKRYISKNYHVYFLVIGLITNGLIVRFMRKYSSNLVFPLFLYICMSGYGASLTGTRQELATAIVIWLIPLAVERKWIKFLFVLWIAFRIHFISILYIITPFLLGEVWNGISIIVIISCILAGFFFDRFAQMLLDASELLGFDNYNSSILYGASINILRVLVYSVSPFMALNHKTKLSQKKPLIRCMCNYTIVAAGFVFIGLFGKANTFGRFGILFEPAIYIALPSIIDTIEDKNRKKIILFLAVVAFYVYFVFGHMKNGIWIDFYRLESIFKWF